MDGRPAQHLHLPLQPNPYLIGLLFVVRTRVKGPRLLLHYPPNPSSVILPSAHDDADESDSPLQPPDQSDNDDSSDSNAEDDDRSVADSDRVARTRSVTSAPDHSVPARRADTKENMLLASYGVEDSQSAATPRPSTPQPHLASRKSSRAEPYPLASRYANKAAKERARRYRMDAGGQLFGNSRDALAKLLAPGSRSAWHGRKLEVGMQDRCFVGCPIFASEDESWGSEKRVEKERRDARTSDTKDAQEIKTTAEQELADSNTESRDMADPKHSRARNIAPSLNPPTALDPQMSSAAARMHPASFNSTSSDLSTSSNSANTDSLNMFNIVAVLAPPVWEHQVRVEEIYVHVVRQLSRAIRRLQQRKGWVEAQLERIERVLGDARGQSNENVHRLLTDKSELYRALSQVSNAIGANRLIHLPIEQQILSLQIPRPLSTPFTPSPGASSLIPQMPGIAVTSARLTTSSSKIQDTVRTKARKDQHKRSVPVQEGRLVSDLLRTYDTLGIQTTAPTSIDPFAALLLLQPAKHLIAQLFPPAPTDDKPTPSSYSPPASPSIAHLRDTPLAAPLAHFLAHNTPRRTLTQLVTALAPSFRLDDLQLLSLTLIRARVARATTLLYASNIYAVSPYADFRPTTFSPACTAFHDRFSSSSSSSLPELPTLLETLSVQDHDPIGAAKPWAALIPRRELKDLYMSVLAWLLAGGWVAQVRTFAWVVVSADVKRAVHGIMARETDAAAGHGRPRSARDDDEGVSLAHRAALRALSPRPPSTASGGSVDTTLHVPNATSRDGADADRDAALALEESLVEAPASASPLEMRYLDYIGARLADDEARRLWPLLVRHLDGSVAVEDVASIEGIKRKAVARVVGTLVREGVVRILRHF